MNADKPRRLNHRWQSRHGPYHAVRAAGWDCRWRSPVDRLPIPQPQGYATSASLAVVPSPHWLTSVRRERWRRSPTGQKSFGAVFDGSRTSASRTGRQARTSISIAFTPSCRVMSSASSCADGRRCGVCRPRGGRGRPMVAVSSALTGSRPGLAPDAATKGTADQRAGV